MPYLTFLIPLLRISKNTHDHHRYFSALYFYAAVTAYTFLSIHRWTVRKFHMVVDVIPFTLTFVFVLTLLFIMSEIAGPTFMSLFYDRLERIIVPANGTDLLVTLMHAAVGIYLLLHLLNKKR